MSSNEPITHSKSRKAPLYFNQLPSSDSPSHLSVTPNRCFSSSSGSENSECSDSSSALPQLPQSGLFTPQTSPLLSRSSSNDAGRTLEELTNLRALSPSTSFFENEFSQGSAKRSRAEYCSHTGDSSADHEDFNFLTKSKPFTPRGTETRIDLERVDSYLKSPATGISSSVAVLQTANLIPTHMTETRTKIDFTRLANKKNTHRRPTGLVVPNSYSHERFESYGRKYITPPPITIPEPIDGFLGKETYKPSFTPTSSQSIFLSFLHILPSSASSRSSQETPFTGRSSEEELKVFSWPRRVLALIFGVLIRSLKFLLTPFNNWVYGAELLQMATNSVLGSGAHHKFRSSRWGSLLAISYVSISVIVFSRDMIMKLGLIEDYGFSARDLSTRMIIPRNLEEFRWLGNLSNGLQIGGSLNDLTSEFFKKSVGIAAATNSDWNLQAAVKRRQKNLDSSSTKNTSSSYEALSSIPHLERFSKLHSKSNSKSTGDIIPFLYASSQEFSSDSITACMYTNIFWLEKISEFVSSWEGPVSLVVESLSDDRLKIIKMVEDLREADSLVRDRVNFHLVLLPPLRGINQEKKAEKMLREPIATNSHLNLARFFSQSEIIWLVGDSRILPSSGLYLKLMENQNLRIRVLAHGNAVVIPTFGFLRSQSIQPNTVGTSSISDMKDSAEVYMKEIFSSIPLKPLEWPQTIEKVFQLTGAEKHHGTLKKLLVMYDKDWGLGKGPTDWKLWQQFAKVSSPETEDMYSVKEYDFHYSPNVVISREGQPWCTERFDYNKAACVYQMYLTGTELWVLPQAWSFTVEWITASVKPVDEARKIKDLISSRLYSKYHQEACMQYGREFLSLGTWEDQRSSHLRAICTQVLKSWGVGVLSEN